MMARIETDKVSSKKQKKLIFCGLENSGKTSIAMVLTENISNLGLIKPTHLVKRTLLKYMNYEIIEHDMGGQQSYIEHYFKEPERYFGETDVCVFVVDVQAGESIVAAMKFYKELLEVFSQLSIKPSIYIFLHKAERVMANASKGDAANMKRAEQQASAINENRFAAKFFQTSIFEPFSVLKAFGTIVTDLFPIDVLLHAITEGLAARFEAEIVILMDDHFMPISDNIQKKESEDLVSSAASNIYYLKQSLDKLKENPSKRLYVEWEGLGFTLMKFPPAPVDMYALIIGKKDMVKVDKIEKEIVDISEEVFRVLKIK